MTRWPARRRAAVTFGEALQVALGCPVTRDGRPLRPGWMSEAQASEFVGRWRSDGRRLEVEHPDCRDVWATLGEVFGR